MKPLLLALTFLFFCFSQTSLAEVICEAEIPNSLGKFKIKHTFESADWKGRTGTRTSLIEEEDGKEVLYGSIEIQQMNFSSVNPWVDEYRFSTATMYARDGLRVDLLSLQLVDSSHDQIIVKILGGRDPIALRLYCLVRNI